MVLALYQVFRLSRHVVTEVVEAKFIVGSVDNIASIGTLSARRIRLVLVDAVN